MTKTNIETKCAVIAVIGAPNAGKSTLVNALVGAKISIVTQKVQTTRARVRGIVMAGAAQLVFIDTPGIFAPPPNARTSRLDRAMIAAAWGGIEGADQSPPIWRARRKAGRRASRARMRTGLLRGSKKPTAKPC